MNLATALTLHFGGPGSGCNPAVGHCGRPSISTKPPENKSDYVSMKATQDWELSKYVKDGVKIASSLTTPQDPYPWKVGTWRMDDSNWNPHGHEIEQLREFSTDQLVPTENARDNWSGTGRGEDVDRYKQWTRQGLQAPPVSVVEADNGELRVSNGNRRYAAAKELGVPLLAWFSPTANIPGMFEPDGKPIKTGLTYELAYPDKKAN